EWGVNTNNGKRAESATFAVNSNQWHHFAATYDGTSISFYVDNKPMGSTPADIRIIANDLPVVIGAYANKRDFGFAGALDEVIISSSARTNFPALPNATQPLAENDKKETAAIEPGGQDYFPLVRQAVPTEKKNAPAKPASDLAYNPGDDFLEWANTLETLAKQREISFRVKNTQKKMEIKDGDYLRSNEELEIELDGAKTTDYNYRFFVDGAYCDTENYAPINYKFTPRFAMPGPHVLTIVAVNKARSKAAFGVNLALIVTGEYSRKSDLLHRDQEQLIEMIYKLNTDRGFLQKYRELYNDTSLLYNRISQISDAWAMAIELFSTEIDARSDYNRVQKAVGTLDMELLKLYNPALKKKDFLNTIASVIGTEKRKLEEMIVKLDKKMKTGGKVPANFQNKRRLILPLLTGGFTDEHQQRIVCESIESTNSIGNCVFRGSFSKRSDWRNVNREMQFYSKIGWRIILTGAHAWGQEKTIDEMINLNAGLSPEAYKLFALKYGSLFYGVCSAELDGNASRFATMPLSPSANSCPPTNRLEAMHRFMENFHKLSTTITPPGIRAMHDSDFGFDNSYLTAAGAEIIAHQVCRGDNTEILMSNTRGACRAFGNPWGGILTQARTLWFPKEYGSTNPYRPMTTASEDFHFLKYLYFCGATILMDEGGCSLFYPEHRQMWAEMTRFAEEHPDPGELQINCAVVRGQASGWQGPRGYDCRNPFGFGRVDAFARDGDRYSPISDYGDRACYRDFDYLDVFFPDYGCYALSKIAFTGTPYGQVDIIGAVLPLEALARYKLLWFLGLNVMTENLAAKLKDYVRGGGRLIMNVEQLKDINGRINLGLMKDLFGCEPENGEDYTSLSYASTKISALKVRKQHHSRVLMRGENGEVLAVGRDFGRGKSLLALTQWQWMLPEAWKETVVKPLIRETGVTVELFPADNRMEHFVYR
ncbi:MAG: hypothetical protein PHV59_12320, partial [Victivallales bacterium]|nr:hypothetical protein [Victivallales bacterium]